MQLSASGESCLYRAFRSGLCSDKKASYGLTCIYQLYFLFVPEAHDHLALMSCTVDDIRYHCTGGGKLACAPSVVHGISQHIAGDKYRIEHSVYHGQGMVLGKHERCHHNFRCVIVNRTASAQQLDGILCSIGIFKIRCGDLRNTLGRDFLGIHVFTKHQRRQNRDLTAGIIAFHIRLRIALRIAFVLCFLQNGIEIRAFFFHFAQDIVRGTV